MKQGQVVIPAEAPQWVSNLVSNICDWVQNLLRGPQNITAYSIHAMPDPTKFAHAIVSLKDGASNKPAAMSDGTIWRYLDGTSV